MVAEQEQAPESSIGELRDNLLAKVYESYQSAENARDLVTTCLDSWSTFQQGDWDKTRDELNQALQNAEQLTTQNPDLTQLLTDNDLTVEDFLKLNMGNSLVLVAEKGIAKMLGYPFMDDLDQQASIQTSSGTIDTDPEVEAYLKSNSGEVQKISDLNGVPIFTDESDSNIGSLVIQLVQAAQAEPQGELIHNVLLLKKASVEDSFFSRSPKSLIIGIETDSPASDVTRLVTIGYNYAHEERHSKQRFPLPGILSELDAMMEEPRFLRRVKQKAAQGLRIGLIDPPALLNEIDFQEQVVEGRALGMLLQLQEPELTDRLSADHNIWNFREFNKQRLQK